MKKLFPSNIQYSEVTYFLYLSIENINFFIKNGVYDKKDVVYNFIIKGNTCSIKFPKYNNINIIKTLNRGYDFGGYSKSLKSVNLNEFKYFIFINDTTIGPFIPRYIKKCKWYKLFTSILSDKIKLVGSTINRAPYTINNKIVHKHIQSMCFGTDKTGVDILIKNNIFNEKKNIAIFNKSKEQFIREFEINMSKIIIDNNYDIYSFNQSENNDINLKHTDIHYNKRYFGITLNPIEIMFIKNNRINTPELHKYTQWNL